MKENVYVGHDCTGSFNFLYIRYILFCKNQSSIYHKLIFETIPYNQRQEVGPGLIRNLNFKAKKKLLLLFLPLLSHSQ